MNVLFVCTGNVCRSPIAEALMRKKFEKYDLDGIVDSAGFSPTTINDAPDYRAVEAAKGFNVELTGNSRIFLKNDFDRFDKIYLMDTKNLREVKDLTRNKNDEAKVDYIMNVIEPGSNKVLPDPIYSGTLGFNEFMTIIDKVTAKIAEDNRK